MPVTSTPTWSGAQAGIIGNAAALAGSAQVNQLLGTHASGLIHQGAPILTPTGIGATAWALPLATEDVDQPFTMSGTVIGRVQIPLLPVGAGADLLVSLCADSSGKPGAMITQTRIPASWITQLAAISGVSGPSTATPPLTATGNPLAVGQFNTPLVGPPTLKTWPTPAASGAANLITPAVATSGNYLIIAGGINAATSALQQTVYTIGWNGSTGLNSATPQPSLPVARTNGALAVTGDTVVYIGGGNSGAPFNTDVYTASWSSSTGIIGSWSSQAAYPTNTHQPGGVATSGETVYVVGSGVSGPDTSDVYYTTVANGQITGWTKGPSLPVTVLQPSVAVVDGFLIVAGGVNAGVGPLSTLYYTPINADGSLGPWRPGPNLPSTSFNANGALQVIPANQGLVISNQNAFLELGMSSDGPGAWTSQTSANAAAYTAWAAFSTGAATWQLFTLLPNSAANNYYTQPMFAVPYISVPLPATGLTNGATYHVLLQQQGGDLNDYLQLCTDVDVYSGNPTLLTSAPDAYSWTAASPAGTAVPLQVFDQTVPYAGAMPWHSWDDNGARITTVVCATTPDQRLLGLCEATRIQTQRNQNAGFESGIAPWQVFNGTAIQSSTQVKSGLFAARITPNGTSSQVFMQSELLPCLPGQQITVSGWLWFTNAVTANTSLSINWYTAGGTLISTSSNSVSAAAATWTQLTNQFTAPTAGTLPYQYAIVPTLGGTPASSQIWYVDSAYSTDLMTPQQSSVVQIEYPASYPGQTWPPLGILELA